MSAWQIRNLRKDADRFILVGPSGRIHCKVIRGALRGEHLAGFMALSSPKSVAMVRSRHEVRFDTSHRDPRLVISGGRQRTEIVPAGGKMPFDLLHALKGIFESRDVSGEAVKKAIEQRRLAGQKSGAARRRRSNRWLDEDEKEQGDEERGHELPGVPGGALPPEEGHDAPGRQGAGGRHEEDGQALTADPAREEQDDGLQGRGLSGLVRSAWPSLGQGERSREEGGRVSVQEPAPADAPADGPGAADRPSDRGA